MKTLAQDVTETLRDWILHGRFKPSTRLEEVPLAQQLNVSRTPVRAALAALASEGLLSHQPKRGYLVQGFDLGVIAAAYEVRSVLEGLACRNAATRGLTPEQIRTLSSEMAAADAEVLSVEPIACMLRKDDPAFKKAVDDSIVRQIKDGSLAKLYDRWFMQPIPPNNVKVGLPLSEATKEAWANPNDKPMESYEVK